MLKVLLADDEMLVRVGIKSSIAWSDYGFELVGEASNGLDAWRLIEETEPDILITDIQMPKLDGLGLLAKIKESGRDIRTIILTCHSDFDYAKQAIHYGVKDYVLKLSMTPDELLAILLELKDELSQRPAAASRPAAHVNSAELRQLFLYKLQSGALDGREALAEQLEALALPLVLDRLVAMRLILETHAAAPAEKGLPLATENLCCNLLEEWLRKSRNGALFSLDKAEFFLLINSPADLEQSAAEIQGLLKKYLNLSVSIGISAPHGPDDAHLLWEEAEAALERRFFTGGGACTCYQACAHLLSSLPPVYDYDTERNLAELLSRADRAQVETLLFPLLSSICASSGTKRRCMDRLDEVLATFSHTAKRFGGTRQEFCREYHCQWEEELHALEFSSAIIPWFAKLIPDFCDYLTRCRNRQYRSEIVLIQDYIKQHYSEKITLDFAASYVFMSPSHFSKLFKKSTGKNFVDYLSEIRIEKAKRLLLESTLLIYQISEQVGYTSFNYFTKVFKKYTGLTPEEYRQTGTGRT